MAGGNILESVTHKMANQYTKDQLIKLLIDLDPSVTEVEAKSLSKKEIQQKIKLKESPSFSSVS